MLMGNYAWALLLTNPDWVLEIGQAYYHLFLGISVILALGLIDLALGAVICLIFWAFHRDYWESVTLEDIALALPVLIWIVVFCLRLNFQVWREQKRKWTS